MHRNSRRRPYRPFGYYFITTNVSSEFSVLDRYEYGHLLEHILFYSAKIHSAGLIAFKINPDHIHLIVQIGRIGTISKFMGSCKRQFSRQVNFLLRQEYSQDQKSKSDLIIFNKFRWQPSYHSHLITNKQDFDNHVNYILKQQSHHELVDNKFCFVDKKHIFKFL